MEAFLDGPDGLFVLLGEAGIGKSAFAAHLAAARSVQAFHACSARERTTLDPVAFARSIAQQLINSVPTFGLHLVRERGIEVNATVDVGTLQGGTVYAVYINNLIVESDSPAQVFQRLVHDPLQRLWESEPDHVPTVVVVDAVDEAEGFDGTNIADLIFGATDLSPRLRWIVTARALEGFEVDEEQVFVLTDDTPENREDVHAYVSQLLAEIEIGVDVAAFAAELERRSEGNFLYLTHVGAMLRRRAAEGGALMAPDELPQGLDGVYREFLDRVLRRRGADEYRRLHRPILGALAVAQTALTFEQIQHVTGLAQQDTDDVLLDIEEFLEPAARADDGPTYRIFHTSFADFLTDRWTNRRYWINGREAHARIADHYWARRGGDLDAYGLAYLAVHLAHADDTDRLLALVDAAWMRARFRGAQSDHRGFVADLGLARAAVLRRDPADVASLLRVRAAREVVRQDAMRFSSDGLQTLVWLSRADEAIAHARLAGEWRYDSLIAIHDALTERGEDRPVVLEEARQAALTIPAEDDRADGLVRVAEALVAAGRPEEALAVGHAMTSDERWRALAKVVSAFIATGDARTGELSEEVSRLAGWLTPADEWAGDLAAAGRMEEAEEFASSIEDPEQRARAFTAVATRAQPRPAARERKQLMNAVREALEAIEQDDRQWMTQDDVIKWFVRAGWLDEARAEAAQGSEWRLRELVPAYARAGDTATAVKLARTIRNDDLRDAVFVDVAPTLVRAGQIDGARELALAVVGDAERVRAQADVAAALRDVAPEEAGETLEAALTAFRALPEADRGSVVHYVAPAVALCGRMEEARALADETGERESEHGRDIVLVWVARALSAAGRYDESRTSAQAIGSREKRGEALAALALELARAGADAAAQVLDLALECTRTDHWWDPDTNAEGDPLGIALWYRALAVLAEAVVRGGRIQLAVNLCRQVRSVAALSQAMCAIAGVLTAERAYGDALKALDHIQLAPEWVVAEGTVGAALAAEGVEFGDTLIARAEDVARTHGEAVDRATMMRKLAAVLAARSHPRADALLDEAAELAAAVPVTKDTTWVTLEAARALIGAGRLDAALALAHAIAVPWAKSAALADVAAATEPGGEALFAEARAIADTTDSVWQDFAFADLGGALARAGRFAQAREVAEHIGGESRVEILCDLARAGDADAATDAMRALEAGSPNYFTVRDQVVDCLLRCLRFDDAVSLIDVFGLDELVEMSARWAITIYELGDARAVMLVAAIADVAGWLRDDWRQAAALLNEAP